MVLCWVPGVDAPGSLTSRVSQTPVSRTQPYSEAGHVPTSMAHDPRLGKALDATKLNAWTRTQQKHRGGSHSLPALRSGAFYRERVFDQAQATPFEPYTSTLPVGDIDQGAAAGPRYRAGWV